MAQYSIKYRSFPELVFTLPIDWSADPFPNNNGCHHFFSLRWVLPMLKSWLADKASVSNPLLIIQDFLTYHAQNKNRFNRYYMERTADHTMAIRLGLLIDIWLAKKSDPEQYSDIDNVPLGSEIEKHLSIMSGDKIYKIPHNHGLMVDAAIISASLHAPEFDLQKKFFGVAETRAGKQIEHMFDEFGFTREHSISYQAYNAIICLELLDLYRSFNLQSELKERIYRVAFTSHYFLKCCLRPDGKFPAIGDSFRRPNTTQMERIRKTCALAPDRLTKETKSFWGENEEGSDCFLVVPQSGFAVIRRQYGPDPVKHATHLMLTAGWHSFAHKQNDDLSFTWFTGGVSWIDEPGYSDQVNRNDVPYADEKMHNVITNLQHPWSKRNSKPQGTRLTGFHHSDDILAIQGRHCRIKNTVIERTLVFLSPNILIVVDYLDSKLTGSFQQRFHFGHGIVPSITPSGDVLCVHSTVKGFLGWLKPIKYDLTNCKIIDSFILDKEGTKLATKAVQFQLSKIQKVATCILYYHRDKNYDAGITAVRRIDSQELIVKQQTSSGLKRHNILFRNIEYPYFSRNIPFNMI